MLLKLNTKPTPRDLRYFGLTMLVAFGIIGGLFFMRGKPAAAEWIWGISAPIGLLALVFPRASWIFYVAWMGIAVIMGSIMSRFIMTLLFFVIITPVSLFFRVMRRDALQISKQSERTSYWVAHKQQMDERFYKHLF